MDQIDETFSTNRLKMPISSKVGLNNAGDTFHSRTGFITSERARTFEFMAECLTIFVFYDCPEPAVIALDFAIGLGTSLNLKFNSCPMLE